MKPLASRLSRVLSRGVRAFRTVCAQAVPKQPAKVAGWTVGAGLLSVPVAYATHDKLQFSTKTQRDQQNHAVKLIQTMADLMCPECDSRHSNAHAHKSKTIVNPTRYANNEIYSLRKSFQDAISGDTIDSTKASKNAFWQQVASQGINLQKMLGVGGANSIPFLAFAYTLIVSEVLTKTYKRRDVDAIRSYEGPQHDWRLPVFNTIGVGTADHSWRISELSKHDPSKFADFLFRLIDRNGDDKLDKNEVQSFVTASRIMGTLPDYMYFYKLDDRGITDKLFERWDLDGNGTLDKTEFLILNQSFYYDHCFAATAYQRRTEFEPSGAWL